MSELVNPDQIEEIVGAPRYPISHLGRANSTEQKVYILHSRQCKESGIDLRRCLYSRALDAGIDHDAWEGLEDRPVILAITDRGLVPTGSVKPPLPAHAFDRMYHEDR